MVGYLIGISLAKIACPIRFLKLNLDIGEDGGWLSV